MRLRVGFGHQFVFGDQTYSSGDEFDVSDDVALALLATGLVLPVDGDWRGITPSAHAE